MTNETLQDSKEVGISAHDANLLDTLGNSYSKQVLETRSNGGSHTEADDERSIRAFDLAEKIGSICFNPDETPKEGEFQILLDGEEEGLLTEARHLVAQHLPEQRTA